MDTTINHGEQSKQSTPEQSAVIPPDVSTIESFHEEVQTSNITAYGSNTDANVIGDGSGDKCQKNSLPVSTRVQVGERQSVGSGSGDKGERGSGNVVGDARVVSRILTT